MNELLYTEGDVRFAVATAKSEIERLTVERDSLFNRATTAEFERDALHQRTATHRQGAMQDVSKTAPQHCEVAMKEEGRPHSWFGYVTTLLAGAGFTVVFCLIVIYFTGG